MTDFSLSQDGIFCSQNSLDMERELFQDILRSGPSEASGEGGQARASQELADLSSWGGPAKLPRLLAVLRSLASKAVLTEREPCTGKVKVSVRKTRSDKGKLLKHRASVSKFLPRKTKYCAQISLQEIDEMREKASLIEDERERRRELNKLGALRSRRIRLMRIEEDSSEKRRLRSMLAQSQDLKDKLVTTIVSLVGSLEETGVLNLANVEESFDILGEIFEEIAQHNEEAQSVLSDGEGAVGSEAEGPETHDSV
mmetsp:Transcript_2285/g.5343  ORF Transcript_2285/g.5343 Transcript_2285/m.5343 type:complete len:255 (+) Transcript_2285:78-842(+)